MHLHVSVWRHLGKVPGLMEKSKRIPDVIAHTHTRFAVTIVWMLDPVL